MERTRVRRRMCPVFFVAVSLLLVSFRFSVAQQWNEKSPLPPTPGPQEFLHDYAKILSPAGAAEIVELQQQIWAKTQTPVVVVTIESRALLGAGQQSIETYARRWFDHWGIGSRDASGKLINRGILLLVSVQDRQARIELGAGWGRRWDSHCEEIMQRLIVPAFKRGNYDRGIKQGVNALGEMAQQGVEGNPAAVSSPTDWSRPPFPFSPVPLWGVVVLFALSAICLVLAFVGWSNRPLRVGLLWAAGILFTLGLAYWILILAGWMWGRQNGYISDGGGGGGSGGFGGGFSGGGGATGSW